MNLKPAKLNGSEGKGSHLFCVVNVVAQQFPVRRRHPSDCCTKATPLGFVPESWGGGEAGSDDSRRDNQGEKDG